MIQVILNNPYFQLVIAVSGLLGGYAAYQQIFKKKDSNIINNYIKEYKNASQERTNEDAIHEIECATVETNEDKLSINGKFIEYNDISALNTDKKYVQEYYGGFLYFMLNDFMGKSGDNPLIGWVYKRLSPLFVISIILIILFLGLQLTVQYFSKETSELIFKDKGIIFYIFMVPFTYILFFLAILLPLMIIRFLYFIYLYRNPNYYYTYCIVIKTKHSETYKLWDERKDVDFINSAYSELKGIVFDRNKRKVSILLCTRYSKIDQM